MIIEERNGDGSMDTTDIVSVDPNATVTPKRVLRAPEDSYEEAESCRLTTDRVNDARDHKLLCNALEDAIRKKVENGELHDLSSESDCHV